MTNIRNTIWQSIGVAVVLFAAVTLLENYFPTRVSAFLTAVMGIFITCTVAVLLEIQRISWTLGTLAGARRVRQPVLRQIAERALAEKDRLLKEVEEQTVRFVSEREMMDLYYDVFALEPANSTIDATSTVAIDRVWAKAKGRKALESNKKAVTRGVKVRRVFIFADTDALNKAREQLKEQKQAGVEVYHVEESELNEGLALDFLVSGSGTSVKYDTDVSGRLSSCEISCVISRAESYRTIFEQILAAATKFDDAS